MIKKIVTFFDSDTIMFNLTGILGVHTLSINSKNKIVFSKKAFIYSCFLLTIFLLNFAYSIVWIQIFNKNNSKLTDITYTLHHVMESVICIVNVVVALLTSRKFAYNKKTQADDILKLLEGSYYREEELRVQRQTLLFVASVPFIISMDYFLCRQVNICNGYSMMSTYIYITYNTVSQFFFIYNLLHFTVKFKQINRCIEDLACSSVVGILDVNQEPVTIKRKIQLLQRAHSIYIFSINNLNFNYSFSNLSQIISYIVTITNLIYAIFEHLIDVTINNHVLHLKICMFFTFWCVIRIVALYRLLYASSLITKEVRNNNIILFHLYKISLVSPHLLIIHFFFHFVSALDTT